MKKTIFLIAALACVSILAICGGRTGHFFSSESSDTAPDEKPVMAVATASYKASLKELADFTELSFQQPLTYSTLPDETILDQDGIVFRFNGLSMGDGGMLYANFSTSNKTEHPVQFKSLGVKVNGVMVDAPVVCVEQPGDGERFSQWVDTRALSHNGIQQIKTLEIQIRATDMETQEVICDSKQVQIKSKTSDHIPARISDEGLVYADNEDCKIVLQGFYLDGEIDKPYVTVYVKNKTDHHLTVSDYLTHLNGNLCMTYMFMDCFPRSEGIGVLYLNDGAMFNTGSYGEEVYEQLSIAMSIRDQATDQEAEIYPRKQFLITEELKLQEYIRPQNEKPVV